MWDRYELKLISTDTHQLSPNVHIGSVKIEICSQTIKIHSVFGAIIDIAVFIALAR